ncbi:flagellar hook-length control protein FliK [Pseudomonas putida]|uniref:flagellar hook-length control protein FliK n=1 Tax=Pseudomonas putida TaxID=303 RepID=UPI0018AA0D16|nr:flagellar hook-length control protein FliK [Pseudomonas putida]MBF8658885.1 flagellar hook-length control protein FliK [Pseudomonas putida]
MPVASNPLLQANIKADASRSASATAGKPQQTLGEQGDGFGQVMAKQGRDKVAGAADKPAASKAADKAEGASSGKSKPADKRAVADDGNGSPTEQATQADTGMRDASLVAGQVTDAQPGAQLIQAQAEAVAPVLQAANDQPPSEEAPDFDPAADALANLPTLRLALEHSAQAKGATSAHAVDPGQQQAQAASVNTLAQAGQGAEEASTDTGEKAFGALLEEGLKDTKGASSDTRIDDFASRLANLTQAATAKTANAVPVNPNPLQQPLSMNQNAWTEGLVNRVMYLSSQNLKSADIQLEPAELGRLNIRVNVAADQTTQVTFISGHVGVRDTLDSQVHRLRELFAQQGLAQPDVNVADQSRGQQQHGQAAQGQGGSSLSGVAARAGEGSVDAAEGELPAEQQVVIGDSAVDYYA